MKSDDEILKVIKQIVTKAARDHKDDEDAIAAVQKEFQQHPDFDKIKDAIVRDSVRKEINRILADMSRTN